MRQSTARRLNMSQVRVRERNESKILYIDNARELVIHTIKYGKKFPKSAMFFVTKDIADTSREIYKEVVSANAIFPKTPQDIEKRADRLKHALGLIDSLDCFIGIAKDLCSSTNISDYGWVHWGELMVKETNLIKKVLQSDEKLTF